MIAGDDEELITGAHFAVELVGRLDDAAVFVDLEAGAAAQTVAQSGVATFVGVTCIDAQHHGPDVVVLDQLGPVQRIAELRIVVD